MKIDELKDYTHIEFEYNEKLEQENRQLRAENEKLHKILKDLREVLKIET